MNKKKKVVRQIKPRAKITLVIIAIIVVLFWFWTNFSQFIIKKDLKIKRTNIQVMYDKQYHNSTGEKKAKALAQLFISDFFTWTNKPRKGSIGGIEFVDKSIVDGFREEVYSSYYQYFTEIRDEDGQNALPQVKNVAVMALRDVAILPLTSRVLFNSKISPKNIVAVDVTLSYENTTKHVNRYHKTATVYLIKTKKGDYKVVKLVSK